MKLKNATILQTILILVGTAVMTLLAVLAFVHIHLGDDVVFGTATSLVAVISEDGILHASEELDENSLNNLEICLRLGETYFENDGKTYVITIEQGNYTGKKLTMFGNIYDQELIVVKLTPVINFSDNLAKTLMFAVFAFAFFFVIASVVSSYFNTKFVVAPIIELKNATDRIACGNLNDAVSIENSGSIKEISELCDSIEALRLKLCESVYYQEKYDENRKFLISGISHDLRTPVTAIRGYIEGILDGVADNDQKREAYLKAAIAKTDTVKTMIEDLLLYSKLDLGQIPFEMQQVCVNEYMREIVQNFSPDCERRGIRLSLSETDVIDNKYYIRIDPERFARVLQNIIDNACKNIIVENGEITVSLRINASSVIIEIRDNGKGISKETLPHIFDRFYRGNAARKNDGGSGLGLTIAKQMTEGMGGRVWATSKLGEGTSILFSFNYSVMNSDR